jgi:hypothetical protein
LCPGRPGTSLEPVSEAPHIDQVPRVLLGHLQLSPDAPDIDLEHFLRLARQVFVFLRDSVEDFMRPQHPARVACHVLEDAELRRRQGHEYAPAFHLTPINIDH